MAKPRVIISSDIGGSDPDDIQSMVHAFLAADRYEIEGLISTPSNHAGRTADIHRVIDAYAVDFANLKTWSSDYPTPSYLKSVTKQGSIDVSPPAGYGVASEGSNHIIRTAHESDEPLWVLTWGSMTDVAQALHDDPSIAGKIKLISIGGWNTRQDQSARDYVHENFENLWWVESDGTHRGMYRNKDGAEANRWRMDDAKEHGALGDLFHEVRPWGLKMGDTPSLLRLIDPDGANNADPAAESWGGEYVKTDHGPNYWTDNPASDLALGGDHPGARTVYEDQAEIYKDMVRLFDRARAPKPEELEGEREAAAPSAPAARLAGDAVVAGTADGAGNPVHAADDQYSVQPNGTLWFNARYLTHNDKGLDGGLKVTAIGEETAAGVAVSLRDDGTIVYRAPKDWQGTDRLTYTVRDADGSTDTAEVALRVGHGNDPLPGAGGGSDPEPVDPEPTEPGIGSGNPVDAANDQYSVQPNGTLWFNARYLTHNDKGLDGGLKVTAIGGETAAGVAVGLRDDGTIVYRAPKEWQGTDRLTYTVRDADGSTDTAEVALRVGHGDDPLSDAGGGSDPEPAEPEPAEPEPTEPGTGGTGNPVVAADDRYDVQPDGKLWFNARYLTHNDKGLDGGLKVVGIAETTAAGVAMSMAADGTIVYRAPNNWQGTDRLTYTVRDADGSTDTAEVLLRVGHGNDPLPGQGGGEEPGGTDPVRILPLGDSHTYGIIATNEDRESGGYRFFLADKLEDAGIPFDLVGRQDNGPPTFDNDHEGYSGIHIQGLTPRIADMMSATDPDVVLLMAGSNDSASDTVFTMLGQMGDLIDEITEHAPDAHILMAGIPPVQPDNTVGMDPEIIAGFNAALPDLAAAKRDDGAKVTFVDTSGLAVSDISEVGPDNGVHMTSAGHEKLAGMWFEALSGLGVAEGAAGRQGALDTNAVQADSSPAAAGPVTAVDDTYRIDAGQSLWFEDRHIAANDKGPGGELEVIAVDDTSAAGGGISWGPDGSEADGRVIYRPLPDWEGVDSFDYTVTDEEGNTDTGTVFVEVGTGDLLFG